MNINNKIQVLSQLGKLLTENNEEWIAAKQKAERENGWFTQGFIDIAINNIITEFLNEEKLKNWIKSYKVADENTGKKVGVVMAGNIPLVGFHDLLCVFISGHNAVIKTSTKDDVLIKFLVNKLYELESECSSLIQFADMLKNCDAYIATGSNNSSRYFEQYFGKYPNIIRKNRTSVAILTGNETPEQLDALADDIFLFFGLGCRNITKLYVPENYDFIPFLSAVKKYDYLIDHNKYKNNYDYQLALLLLNNKKYMSSKALLLSENHIPFSAVSNLHYEYYKKIDEIIITPDEIQCIVGINNIPFGYAQTPSLTDYADGADTMQFLSSI